jgi:hypothetical protein
MRPARFVCRQNEQAKSEEMGMKTLGIRMLLVLPVLLAIGCAGTRSAQSPDKMPVLVELFTSQGNASCPAAEELLAKLTSEAISGAEVVPLAWHVNYHDDQYWADPFASIQYTDRQRAYARELGKQAYTPQMMIDGQIELNGSDESAARAAIAAAARKPKGYLDMAVGPDKGMMKLKIKAKDLVKITRGRSVEVLLAITEDGVASDVRGGENKGRKLLHPAVVREFRSLGGGTPNRPITTTYETTFPVRAGWQSGRLRVIVWVADTVTAKVYAIATAPL